MLMHDPPHPGAFIRRQCLEPLGLTVAEAAKGLGVSRNTLSEIRRFLKGQLDAGSLRETAERCSTSGHGERTWSGGPGS